MPDQIPCPNCGRHHSAAIKTPWLKFRPEVWRADPRLRNCSAAGRGVWIDLLSYMHEAEPYGHLIIGANPPTNSDLARHLALPLKVINSTLKELEQNGVFSRTPDGIIYSRRMVRDHCKESTDRENGAKGGNPRVKGGVNPPVNARVKSQESREQKEGESPSLSRNASAISPEAWRLYDQCLHQAGITDHPLELAGMPYQAEVWLTRGYDKAKILTTFATIAARRPLKPLAYFCRAIEGAQTETPREHHNGQPTNCSTVARRLLAEAYEREADPSD